MLAAFALPAALVACGKEARTLASDQPQTPPTRANDPRASRYQDNVYQVAQGARYFIWYGCGRCHGPDARGALDLGDDRWRRGGAIDQVYASIADGHAQASYGRRIPVEQLWQITAYVRDLANKDPAKTRREGMDGSAEPQGAWWSGPVR